MSNEPQSSWPSALPRDSRYILLVECPLQFSPAGKPADAAMAILNLRFTGKLTMPLEDRPAPEHVESHHRCNRVQAISVPMGLLPDGTWEPAFVPSADALAVMKREAIINERIGMTEFRIAVDGEATSYFVGDERVPREAYLAALETARACGRAVASWGSR